MHIDTHYLSPEGRAAVKARADALRDDLAARRILRASAQRLDIEVVGEERRSANQRRNGSGDRRETIDRRGAVTVEIDGQIVIQPRSDLARFDCRPADVTAFMLDDAFRSETR
jgi:hypothetical protein